MHLLITAQGTYKNSRQLQITRLVFLHSSSHMPDDTEKLVLNGQDHLGDIHLLSELAHPDSHCDLG